MVSSVIIAAQNPLGPARLIDYVERLSNVVFLMHARIQQKPNLRMRIRWSRPRDSLPVGRACARNREWTRQVWPNRVTSAMAKLLAQTAASFSADPADRAWNAVWCPAALRRKSKSHWGRFPQWSVLHKRDSMERTTDILIPLSSTAALPPMLSRPPSSILSCCR